MENTRRYNAVIDEIAARLTLMEDSGIAFAGLGPANALEILFESFAGCTLCPRRSEGQTIAPINRGAGGKRAELAIVSIFEITDKASRALLEKMINAMGLKMEEVYITSVIKCVTKDPGSSIDAAMNSCKPLLLRELEIVSPVIVVTLGSEAAKALIDTPLAFNSIRGRFQESAAIGKTRLHVMPTHPLELLMGNKERKKESWSDLKKVMSKLKLAPVK